MRYGRWAYWINGYAEGSKISRYEALKQVEKSRGETPRELKNAPELSANHADCWEAYISLKEHSYPELESYMRVTGLELSGWEIEAIMTLARYKDREPKWPI